MQWIESFSRCEADVFVGYQKAQPGTDPTIDMNGTLETGTDLAAPVQLAANITVGGLWASLLIDSPGTNNDTGIQQASSANVVLLSQEATVHLGGNAVPAQPGWVPPQMYCPPLLAPNKPARIEAIYTDNVINIWCNTDRQAIVLGTDGRFSSRYIQFGGANVVCLGTALFSGTQVQFLSGGASRFTATATTVSGNQDMLIGTEASPSFINVTFVTDLTVSCPVEFAITDNVVLDGPGAQGDHLTVTGNMTVAGGFLIQLWSLSSWTSGDGLNLITAGSLTDNTPSGFGNTFGVGGWQPANGWAVSVSLTGGTASINITYYSS